MALAADGLNFVTRGFTVTGINQVGDNIVISLTSTARTKGTAFAEGASTITYAVKAAQASKLPNVGDVVNANLSLSASS
jgi:hypothetical protein